MPGPTKAPLDLLVSPLPRWETSPLGLWIPNPSLPRPRSVTSSLKLRRTREAGGFTSEAASGPCVTAMHRSYCPRFFSMDTSQPAKFKAGLFSGHFFWIVFYGVLTKSGAVFLFALQRWKSASVSFCLLVLSFFISGSLSLSFSLFLSSLSHSSTLPFFS